MANKVYHITGFPGHYPVGTAAVIVAGSRIGAFTLLQKELKEHGLEMTGEGIGPNMFVEVDQTYQHAIVLNDGNY